MLSRMATWQWVERTIARPTVTNGTYQTQVLYVIPSGWALQRVICQYPLSLLSDDSGSAVGNPIYAPMMFHGGFSVQRSDGDTQSIISRGQGVNAGAWSTANVPNYDRVGIWAPRWDLYDFDVNVRMESGNGASVNAFFAAAPLYTAGANTIVPTYSANISGTLRFLLSQPG